MPKFYKIRDRKKADWIIKISKKQGRIKEK